MMKAEIELILGGARSGKSHYAEQRAIEAHGTGSEILYLATATGGDEEMAHRIAHHQSRRPATWRTIEEPLQLADRLRELARPDRLILVDCLTLWLTNLLLGPGLEPERGKLLQALPTLPGKLLLVSNEVGWSIVPENALARVFRDEQGRLNQEIATRAQRVTLIAAGLPLQLKPKQ